MEGSVFCQDGMGLIFLISVSWLLCATGPQLSVADKFSRPRTFPLPGKENGASLVATPFSHRTAAALDVGFINCHSS